MAAEVIVLPVETRLPIPPSRVLAAAGEAGMTRVIVIGEADDGSFYFASSDPDSGLILLDMERAKRMLMRQVESR
jgi:hypothetical protein